MPPHLTGTERVARFLSVRHDARVEPELAKLFAKRSLPTARRGYDKETTDALLDELKSCLEKLLAERNSAQAQVAELAERLATIEAAEEAAELAAGPDSEQPLEPGDPPLAAAEAPEEEADEPQTELEPGPGPPVAAAEPPDQVGEPEHENTEANDIDQSAAATQAAVLDEFAEANQELERLAEEARARVRALAERLASGPDPED